VQLAETIRNEKARLRLEMRQRRSPIIATGGADLSERLASQSLDFAGVQRGTIVSAFSSMPDELDTGPLLLRLHAQGMRLCLPVMQGRGKPLLFRAWSPGDQMKAATWGIREPTDDKPPLEPQVVLTPLLAFDRHGWRLGYGGGFFDRTLRVLRDAGSVVAVGLGLDELKVDAVPHLDYDERLDWVLTPSGPLRCLE
jgi:5-formyltetrahydrofolate cyclo-ligase